jgi:GT2 family glycosyltransferase
MSAEMFQFPVTICVVCYGRNSHLARQFLERLYTNTDTSFFILRAGLNEVEEATSKLFQDAADAFGNVEMFFEPENVYKIPLMRRMFYERKLKSEWMIWFDDDSYPAKRDWLQRFAHRVEREPEVAQWGELYFTEYETDNVIVDVIKKASWYRGLEFESKNVGKFLSRFSSGGFWAMRTETIYQLDWPDKRILQAAEDVLLGAALYQHELCIRSFEYGIEVNTAPRRNPSGFGVNAIKPY